MTTESIHPPKPTKQIPVRCKTGDKVHLLETRRTLRWTNGKNNTVCQHGVAEEFLAPGTEVTCKACLNHY